MKFEQYIAIHLALIVCLSSFMLGMGQGDVVLPIITLVGAGASLWVVDFKKLFHLGPVLSNILILLILLSSVGYLMQAFDASFGGSLFAIAILRVLVFFQLVLLFRKKENRICWNIMMVSFLEVIVATVFQQTVIFGLFVILYLFISLTIVTLMHLNSDRNYFTEHVFLRSLLRTSWKGIFSRKCLAYFAKLALTTMFSGPLAIIARLRGQVSQLERPVNSEQPDASGIWEESLVSPLSAGTRSTRETVDTPTRWPLAREKAAFSGSMANRSGLIGIDREFYYRLVVGTVASLVVGLLIFFLTPRQDFRISRLEMQQENWQSSSVRNISGIFNTVGFSDEIRLGTLGTVLDNPSEVMSVTFSQLADFGQSNAAETDYAAIQGQSVYFRGVALAEYARGRWSGKETSYERRSLPSSNNNANRFGFPSQDVKSEEYVELFRDFVDFPMDSVINRQKISGVYVLPENWRNYQFQPGSQSVRVQCGYVSASQQTIFAVWPFFLARSRDASRFQFLPDRIVNDNRIRGGMESQNRRMGFQFLTYAFQNGSQATLTPCLESVDLRKLLAFDDSALPTLGQTALQWDAEHQNASSIERARNIEQHFLTDSRYYYALGGVARNSSLDPLEDFVRDHPGGHCEYFAGTTAMMLRKIGIPSRVVVGYRMDSDIAWQRNGQYVVRQSDAHSWVEAYIPPQDIPDSLRNGPYSDWWQRGGWLRLDPTAPLRDVMAQTGFWANLKYRATGFWNDYIINFNAVRQEGSIYNPVTNFVASMKERFFDAEYWKTIGRAVTQRYAEIFRQMRQGNWQGNDLLLLCVPLLIILAVSYCIYRLIRKLVREMRGMKLARAKRQRLATVEFYRRFEKILQRIGLTRKPNETQREFAARASADLVTMLNLTHFFGGKNRPNTAETIATTSGDMDLLPQQLVETFYRVRYGRAVLTPPETEEINTLLIRLETAATTCRQAT